MKSIAKQLANKGAVEHHHDALNLISMPGDVVTVFRGCLRSLVMACPDGCGEILTINLDPRAGKAWRLFERDGLITLFPSVWRDTGCASHFILWRNRIDWLDESWWQPSALLTKSVLLRLSTTKSRSYVEIADELNELPWDVSAACHALVRDGRAQADPARRGFFLSLEG